MAAGVVELSAASCTLLVLRQSTQRQQTMCRSQSRTLRNVVRRYNVMRRRNVRTSA